MPSPSNPLVAVIGPTGSGKSELAVTLAQSFDGEIINFDSIQVYRDLNIGSAKPSVDEQGGVPHHLLGVLGLDEELTAGAFADSARAVLADIAGRRRIPILVGGTGFYLRALLDGLSPAPGRDQALRDELARRAPVVLHRFLRRRDPTAAARIHPKDGQKLIRAIEIHVLAGRSVTATQAEPRGHLRGYSAIKVGLAPERSALCERLNRRTQAMFERGLLDETRVLLAQGVAPQAKPLQSLGYKQAVAYLSGAVSLESAIEDCQIKTRQYAKRQMTWFRAENGVFWLSGFGDDPSVREQAIAHIRACLSS